jgi:hypothetical protein
MNKNLTEKIRNDGLDKFYTKPVIVDICIEKIKELYNFSNYDLIIEPSAGCGNFYEKIPSNNKIGIDIEPEGNKIIKKDFLTYKPNLNNYKNIMILGNPPFGKVSSLAVKFFNHSSEFANLIAFILPRTFRKVSIQNKLNKKFHLMYDEDIPINPCSFEPPMMVKCCFQIWERKEKERCIINFDTKHKDWNFLSYGPKDKNGQPTPPNGADFALRAYGGKIGDIKINELKSLRPKSWHWIKSNIDKNKLIENFSKLDFSNSENTARQNSMGRGELVFLYKSYFD